MAILYITEHADSNEAGRDPQVPPVATQQITSLTTSPQASSAFNAITNRVVLHTDVACNIAFGTAPTAATTDMLMAANETRAFRVRAGDKVSVRTPS